MKTTDIVLGILIGLTGTLAGSFLFISLFTNYSIAEGLFMIRQTGQLSKILSLGAIVNLAAFFILLRIKKDHVASGVLAATILLTVVTLVLQFL